MASKKAPRVPPHVTLNSGNQDLLAAAVEALNNPSLASRSDSIDSTRSTGPRSYVKNHPLSKKVHDSREATESVELLIPPPKSRRNIYRDNENKLPSPTQSAYSSRRSSISSDGWQSQAPLVSPFNDSRSPSRAGSDDEVTTQTVGEKYNVMPLEGLLVYPEDVEKDDYLHNPDINDTSRDCDVFTRRGIVNLGSLAILSIGLFIITIGFPVLTFVQKLADPSKICAEDPDCLSVGSIPLLKNIPVGLIDPATPRSAMKKTAADGTPLQLVFSDEFNTDGRTFYPDDDPWFEAVDLWYGVTQDLEWYDPDAITTKGGALEISFEAFLNHNLNYRSGMLQSWNKLCFKGGRMEASISLPGEGSVSGLWPGFWSMGNLGRPGYAATTDGMWPYSYDHICDAGITPNQSDPDGLSYLPGMRLPACTCKGEDHPSPGLSRSAPEIDALEATVNYLGPGQTNIVGEVSQSFQVAPFDINYTPDYDFVALYDPTITSMNVYRGGVFQQAMSGLSWMNNNWYDGNAYQVFAYEYEPGSNGHVTWFIGDTQTWMITGDAIGPNGNIGQRTISEEPMAMVLNVGMSATFARIDAAQLQALYPAKMRVDYIRIYQDPDAESMTCDPPDFPTTEYIQDHRAAYSNVNLTSWENAGFSWPKNKIISSGC